MLALICGAGALPAAVAQAAPERPLVAVLDGFAPDGLTPDLTFRIETLGTLIATLKARGVSELCLCGHIRRPQVDLAAIDTATMPLIPVLSAALRQGDDGALRAVMGLFADAGFAIRAAHEAAPALLPAPGVLSAAHPYDGAEADAALGDAVSAEQGAADLGQACVIRAGAVLAREDEAGTDAMLAQLRTAPPSQADPLTGLMDGIGDLLGSAADWLSNAPRAGLLYKAPKPGQDRRADLPVIGPHTIRAVAAAGLAGIVIEAGGVMVLDRARCVALCDEAGLFLWVRAR